MSARFRGGPLVQYTPGPWTAVVPKKLFPQVLIGWRRGIVYSDLSGPVDPQNMALTVNVGPDPVGLANGKNVNTMETCVANARLIAAAPDLLTELRDVLMVCGGYLRGADLKLLESARAAVARVQP